MNEKLKERTAKSCAEELDAMVDRSDEYANTRSGLIFFDLTMASAFRKNVSGMGVIGPDGGSEIPVFIARVYGDDMWKRLQDGLANWLRIEQDAEYLEVRHMIKVIGLDWWDLFRDDRAAEAIQVFRREDWLHKRVIQCNLSIFQNWDTKSRALKNKRHYQLSRDRAVLWNLWRLWFKERHSTDDRHDVTGA